MGPKKKKPVRNALWFFADANRRSFRAQGYQFTTTAELIEIAHPLFKTLTEEEKQEFQQMEKAYKLEMRSQKGDAYRRDNTGQLLSQRRDTVKERQKEREAHCDQLISTWPPNHKDLLTERFYIAGVQHLYADDEGRYWPCELSMVEYSMAEGLTDEYHVYPQPDPTPMGSALDIKQKSEEEHGINLRFERFCADHRQTYDALRQFVKLTAQGEVPPIFCEEKHRDLLVYTLTWLYRKAEIKERHSFTRVMSVEDLIKCLFQHAGQQASLSYISDTLLLPTFDNVFGTRCTFHDDLDTGFCSMYMSRKVCYIISDIMQQYYGFTLTSKHVPVFIAAAAPDMQLTEAPTPEPTRYVPVPGRGRGSGGRGAAGREAGGRGAVGRGAVRQQNAAPVGDIRYQQTVGAANFGACGGDVGAVKQEERGGGWGRGEVDRGAMSQSSQRMDAWRQTTHVDDHFSPSWDDRTETSSVTDGCYAYQFAEEEDEEEEDLHVRLPTQKSATTSATSGASLVPQMRRLEMGRGIGTANTALSGTVSNWGDSEVLSACGDAVHMTSARSEANTEASVPLSDAAWPSLGRGRGRGLLSYQGSTPFSGAGRGSLS